MSTQRYSVTPHPIETLLTWVKSGEIALPEIQQPFVHETARIEGMVSKVDVAIERPQEYRTALIAAAVTWQSYMRRAAA